MKKEYCACCGQSIMKHNHNFSKALAGILISISQKYGPGEQFHLQKDLQLSKNQYNNVQKLQYWGLLIKYYDSNRIRKGGYWVLTPYAGQILNGNPICKTVTTFNNKIIESSRETTTLYDCIGFYDLPEVWAARAESIESMPIFRYSDTRG